MSIICGVIKNGVVALSGDTLSKSGSLEISNEYQKDSEKIYSFKTDGDENFIGVVGYTAVSMIIEHLLCKKMLKFDFSNRLAIYKSLLRIHKILKKDYFLESKDGNDDQPVESNQINALLANKNGLFEIGSYREVSEYRKYWAIGSGYKYALGSLVSNYNRLQSAERIAISAVTAACEFDDSCGKPITCNTIEMK